MNECRWCGTEYEWSDRVSSALCRDCAAEAAEDSIYEAAVDAAYWDALKDTLPF